MDEFNIFLKSRNGYSIDGTPAQVQYDFSNHPYIIDQSDVYLLGVNSACIKVTWYNVNTYNNLLKLSGVTYTIPPSNYNVYTLATVLTSMLTALNITVTYDDIDNNYTLTSTTVDFNISSESTCDELLGLDFTLNNILYSTSKSLEGALIADLSYTTVVNVTSPELINENIDTFSISAASDILESIEVTVNSLGIIYYKGTTYTQIFKKVIDRFTIILKDENNRVLDMRGGWYTMKLNFKVIPDPRIKQVMNYADF